MYKMNWLIGLLLLPVVALAQQGVDKSNQPILEKYKDYYHKLEVEITKPDAQVIEYFSYNCSHCYAARKGP